MELVVTMKVLYSKFMMFQSIDEWKFKLYGEECYDFFDDPKDWNHMVYPFLIGSW